MSARSFNPKFMTLSGNFEVIVHLKRVVYFEQDPRENICARQRFTSFYFCANQYFWCNTLFRNDYSFSCFNLFKNTFTL